MTARERFHAVMSFRPGVRTLLWEFGYWAATIERWYGEGLQRTWYSLPPGYAAGSGIYGEGLPFPEPPEGPSIAGYRENEVHNLFGLDPGATRVPLLWRHCPSFQQAVLEEDDTTRLVINSDGVTVRVKKQSDSLPHPVDWPMRDRSSWERIRAERFGLNIMDRFPPRWKEVAASYRQRDYPVGLVMNGFFAAPREMMGVVNQLTMYHDDPALMHDIHQHLTNIWLTMLEEVVARVELDFVTIWEDMSFKNGPFISPDTFAEFFIPYYRQITGFLHEHGMHIITVDTDGDCSLLIPGFLEAGVTGLYPFEAQAGMDIVQVRKQYPRLLMQGGVDKINVARGREAIDAELAAKLPFMLSQGGYIPYCDHLVPPDVPWEHFRYYRERLAQYVERYRP